MFGALEFSDKMAGAGIQPIIGCSLAIDFADQDEQRRAAGHPRALPRLVLLAADEEGYRNVMRLSSRAFLEPSANDPPHMTLAALASACDGRIALTGGPGGPLDQAIAAGQLQLADARCAALLRFFGDRLYVELQRHGLAAERTAESKLIDLAYAKGIALVATNQPYFGTVEDYEAHDALICIADGRPIADADRRQLTPEHRFKSRAEMAALFADLPEALASSIEIAERSAFRPKTRTPILPRFTADGAGEADEPTLLRQLAERGLARRIAAHGGAAGPPQEDYPGRLAVEVRGLPRPRYAGLLLIVSDLIHW